MKPKIYTFTEDGGNLFSARVEYWDYANEEVYLFSKVFLDAESRDQWVKDKRRALRLVGPIPPLFRSSSCPSTSPVCLAA